MTSSNKKAQKRKEFKLLRSQRISYVEPLIFKEVSNELQRLLNKGAIDGHIGIYWPLKDEVDLRALKGHPELTIALPASNSDGSLQYHPWETNDLIKDFCNIPAPLTTPPLQPQSMSLLLVPAIAMDQDGMRLGYGAGFFDRLRAQKDWRAIPALGVLPEDCISSKPLPRDWWDIAFDGWISENGVRKT